VALDHLFYLAWIDFVASFIDKEFLSPDKVKKPILILLAH
jgi:hypothetical protein